MHQHFKLYKPHRCLSQFVHKHTHRKNKRMLGDIYDFPEGTMSIGRLDENSEGLLLLTTDGKVSFEILRKKYEKEYYVQVDGEITSSAIDQIVAGVDISVKGKSYTTHPAKARIIDKPDLPPGLNIRGDHHGPTSWISVTICEGKYRQVRKMTAAVGFPTLRLIRIRIDDIWLADMQPSEVHSIDLNKYTEQI